MGDIEELSKIYSEITIDELMTAFYEENERVGKEFQLDISIISKAIDSLISSMEKYEIESKKIMSGTVTITQQIQKFELQKKLIYKQFFEVQNLINRFIGQHILMTYVHVDENGKRELRLFDNDINHLKASEVSNYGRNYAKLGYEVNNHYLLLKNSLSDKDNEGLQNTAKEVEYRYIRYKKRILWKTLNDNWIGYKLTNRGPINEAFTAFYIRSIQLNNSLNENINTFMTYPGLGVISADNANGFLIGDVSMGGVQFAVKGQFGSPQNFKTIIKWLKEIKQDNFSISSLQNFIQRFTIIEQEKARTLVRPMTERSIASMVQFHEDNLLKPFSVFEK